MCFYLHALLLLLCCILCLCILAPEALVMINCQDGESKEDEFEIIVDGIVDEKYDIFSAGCVLFWTLFDCHPFSQYMNNNGNHNQLDANQTYKNILQNNIVVDNWNDSKNPKNLYSKYGLPTILLIDLIKQCLNPDPCKRPSAKQVLKHPFFKTNTKLNASSKYRHAGKRLKNRIKKKIVKHDGKPQKSKQSETQKRDTTSAKRKQKSENFATNNTIPNAATMNSKERRYNKTKQNKAEKPNKNRKNENKNVNKNNNQSYNGEKSKLSSNSSTISNETFNSNQISTCINTLISNNCTHCSFF